MPSLLTLTSLCLSLRLSTLVLAQSVTYTLPNLPTTWQSGQTGTNACGSGSSQTCE